MDTIRTETLQDILENSAPQRVVQEFMKFVAGGKGQYGEVGLRENERAMLDQARQQRRMRAEVRDAFAQDEARQQKKVEGKQRGQLRERDFAQRRAERRSQQGAQPQSVPLSEATRETDAVAQMPAAEQVPTLDQLMERAAQPAARTPTVLDRTDGPQPTVTEKKPEPEPTPPKPPKKPLPKKEPKGDKIKREVAERNKQTRERLTLKPKVEPKPTPKPAKRERSAAADKALDRIYDLSTNLDKPGLVRFASALRTKGQITPEDNAEIQRMSKDRDMGAEDIANELTTMVELADERTAKAEPAPEPKAAPEPDMQDDDSLSYDAVLEEAQSYLDGDNGALKAWQYNQLTKLATDKAVSPEALMDLLDAALEQSAKAAVGKSTGTKARRDESVAAVQARRRKLDKALATLRAELDKLGLKQASVRMSSVGDLDAAGEYDYALKTIAVAYELGERRQLKTLHHEVIHYLRDIGALTDDDWATLEKAAEENRGLQQWYEKNYRDRYDPEEFEANRSEEIIAEMFAGWMDRQRSVSPGIRGIFERLARFFRTVFRSLDTSGFDTADAVFRAIAEGRRSDAGIDLFASSGTTTGVKARRSRVDENINRLPENLRGPVYTITDTLGNAAQKGLVWAAFTEDLADMARNLIPASKDYVRLMMGKVVEREKLDRQINDIAERFQNLPIRFQNLGAGTVNGFIQDMDAAGEWAFKPTWLDKAGISYDFDSESDIAQRFEKLPKAAQDVIRDMFEQNFKLLRMKKETAEQSIAGTYNELISAAKARKADDEVKSLDADRKEALAEVARLMAIQENMPWASRRRYGDYVVVAKSKELKEAIANDEPPKVINDLKAQEDHYFVQRYETFAEAQAEARKLKESGLYATSLAREADKVADELVGGKEMMLAFQRLRDYIKSQAGTAGVNDKVLAGINRLAADLYIGALKSTSSRKAELRRLGVAGGDMDMMRNFVTQGRADAHFIGAMKFNEDILDAMNRMRREAGSDENENPQQAMRIYNEMMLRHLSGMSYTPSRLADMVKNATSSWMLTTNPSYYLQNLTQPWVLSLPYIAGKHGHSNATSNYLAAYRQIAKIWGERLSPLEIEKIADPNVRQAIEDLANRGSIDIGAEKDMGNFESLSKGPVANAWSRVSTALRNATRKTEAINRVATAMVAYQLERRAGATHEQAVDYAYRVNRLTNGSYDGFNAPRYMRGPVGSVLTQFKKFQLMQVTLLARLMHSSLKAADPVERAIARRTLAYTLGHTAVLAGAMGLPGMAAITWALNSLLGDDDEPADIEQSIRDAIGDEAIANLLLKGAPTLAGTDISSRIGMGQAFSVIPYVEPELNREGYEKTFTALAGPFFGGLLPKMVDGLGLMRDGDYYKGLARMLPNGLGNGINAMVEASDGVRKRNGDVLLTPEEIDFGQTFARLIGVQTTEVSERQRRTTREINIEQFYADRSKELNQRFAEARENNDVEEMSAIRKEWMSLQTKRVENGLKRQPVSSLMRYVKAKKRREDATVRGVQYRPGSPAYQRALDEADEE